MTSHLHKNLFFSVFILLTSFCGYSQATCPSNIDFETGNFNGWVCKTGSVSAVGGQNTINWTATGQATGRHTIIPSSNLANDFYGNFPVRCPNGSRFSVQLGNTGTGSQAEGIFYNYTIPANANNFSLLYHYAVVFQNPTTNHTSAQQPRFQARIVNLTDNSPIGCVSFDFTASGSLPGFKVSPRSTTNNIILYKDWTAVTLNLNGYAGKTIQVEFITSDCTQGGHFGYGYIDINSSCSSTIIGSTICSGDSVATLTAPFGFESYQWFADNTFTQTIGSSQVLTLNPAPTTGATFPVIVTPYQGYGCVDTVYASITAGPRPVSNAGSDASACKYQQVQLGTAPDPSLSYSWTPANLVSNPAIANPAGFATSFAPQNFVVKTTDLLSGCYSNDTVTIIPKVPDTAIQVSGVTSGCSNQPINTTFQVTNLATNIQWYNNAAPVSGANNSTYTPAASGSYWAQFSQAGCTDSTRPVSFIIYPSPQAAYNNSAKDTQCITNNSFPFNNTSSISDNSSLTYLWRFGDGSVSQQANPVKYFTAGGVYNIQLIASSATCADSTFGVVYVLPNALPEFKWDSVCSMRPVQFTNLTNENGSTSINYIWDFANGSTASLKEPSPIIYKDSGIYNVSLKITALGCESDPKIITHNINVNKALQPTKYSAITVPQGYTMQIFARNSKGANYTWSPASQLNKSNVRAPYFTGVNDTKYLITIADQHTCVVTDTLQMLVLKKKGYYLPNAFTPNGDGLNDVLKPYVVGMKTFKKFSVYNRLGNLIFTTATDGGGWNGTYNGLHLDTGAFVWLLEYIDTDDKMIVQRGAVMLVK